MTSSTRFNKFTLTYNSEFQNRAWGAALAVATLITLTWAPIASAQCPELAFTGALGFGRYSAGGRGGTTYTVTSLSDPVGTPVAGTLRYGLEVVTGPRTILFSTGGTITLSRVLMIEAPYITIDGRPTGGLDNSNITIVGYQTQIGRFVTGGDDTRDIIVRYIRFRVAPTGTAMVGGGERSLNISGAGGHVTRNVIIDHCSIERSADDDLSIWESVRNVTIQWCFIGNGAQLSCANCSSDPFCICCQDATPPTTCCPPNQGCQCGPAYGINCSLCASVGSNHCPSWDSVKACVIGGPNAPAHDEYLTMCYNLIGEAGKRTPIISAPSARIEFFNNAIMNSVQMMRFDPHASGDSPRINIINNYFQYQSNFPSFSSQCAPITTAGSGTVLDAESIYIAGNHHKGEIPATQWELTGVNCAQDFPSGWQRASAWDVDSCFAYTAVAADAAKDAIFSTGGCRGYDLSLDAIDADFVDRCKEGEACIPPFDGACNNP